MPEEPKSDMLPFGRWLARHKPFSRIDVDRGVGIVLRTEMPGCSSSTGQYDSIKFEIY
jgi:hypothetical protein